MEKQWLGLRWWAPIDRRWGANSCIASEWNVWTILADIKETGLDWIGKFQFFIDLLSLDFTVYGVLIVKQ